MGRSSRTWCLCSKCLNIYDRAFIVFVLSTSNKKCAVCDSISTSMTIFVNNKSTKFCQIALRIKRFIHKNKSDSFFSAWRCSSYAQLRWPRREILRRRQLCQRNVIDFFVVLLMSIWQHCYTRLWVCPSSAIPFLVRDISFIKFDCRRLGLLLVQHAGDLPGCMEYDRVWFDFFLCFLSLVAIFVFFVFGRVYHLGM